MSIHSKVLVDEYEARLTLFSAIEPATQVGAKRFSALAQ